MKKTFFAGLLAGIVMAIISFVFGWIIGIIFPTLNAEYSNTSLFRPWNDPLMYLMLVEPVILGIILAWLFKRTKDIIPENKAFYFGLSYWTLTIPGMIMSYSSFPVSLLMTITWSVSIFLQAMCGACIFKKMIK